MLNVIEVLASGLERTGLEHTGLEHAGLAWKSAVSANDAERSSVRSSVRMWC